MANLNLSQFGEKLFVADADHTFIWDTAASISKRVSRNSWLNSGTLTSDAPVTISQTWGTTGTYTAFKVVANETAVANTASNLLELWSGSPPTLKAYVKKLGSFVGGVVGANSPAALAFPLSGAYSVGVYSPASYKIQFAMAYGTVGGPVAGVYTGLQYEMTAGVLSWGITAQDIVLARDSQNTLALRNGINPQTFNVYGTSSSSNTVYERMFAKYNATDLAFQIGTETAGATLRPLDFVTGGTRRMTIATAGNVGIGTTAPGALLHVAGNPNPTILIENTLASGYSQFLFKNTVVTGDGFWLNGSAQSGYGGPSSFNIFASSGPIAFHTNTVANALSIAQSGAATFAGNVGIGTTSPTSKLQVTGGDVEIETVTSGIIMKAAGTSTRYRITLNAGGTALVFTAI